MAISFEQVLIAVWWQVLIENSNIVELGAEHYPVRQTPKSRLRQVDFVFEGSNIRELEQNPQTNSQWAKLARSGKKWVVVQIQELAQLRKHFGAPHLKTFPSETFCSEAHADVWLIRRNPIWGYPVCVLHA
jgi:hypothetical protein